MDSHDIARSDDQLPDSSAPTVRTPVAPETPAPVAERPSAPDAPPITKPSGTLEAADPSGGDTGEGPTV